MNELKGGFVFIGVLALAMVGLAVWNSVDTPKRRGGDVTVEEGSAVKVGEKAPEVVAKTLDGKDMRLSDHRGKVAVLDFWFTTCGPCQAMIPHEKEIVRRFDGRPLVWLGVNTDRDPDDAADFAKRRGLTWANWADPGHRIAMRFGVDWFPRLFILDGEGVVRHMDTMDHPYRGEELDAVLDKLVREQEAKNK